MFSNTKHFLYGEKKLDSQQICEIEIQLDKVLCIDRIDNFSTVFFAYYIQLSKKQVLTMNREHYVNVGKNTSRKCFENLKQMFPDGP